MGDRRALGRGLEQVLADAIGPRRVLPVGCISPNPRQPRHKADKTGIETLAASIRRHGVLQPLVVSEQPGNPGQYHLVAGERRWHAARMAGLDEVPATIVETDDRSRLELALVENLQRTDLGPLDRAQAYGVLVNELGQTQEEVSKSLGVSRPAVANALRLLNLDAATLAALADGRITEGHARALLAVAAGRARAQIVVAIEREGLSVRQVEQRTRATPGNTPPAPPEATPEWWRREATTALEAIQRKLGSRVRLRGSEARGRIELEYHSREDLGRLLEQLRGP